MFFYWLFDDINSIFNNQTSYIKKGLYILHLIYTGSVDKLFNTGFVNTHLRLILKQSRQDVITIIYDVTHILGSLSSSI
jgi:hypothetical protein